MADLFLIEENLDSFITLSFDDAIATAIQTLQHSAANFAVVGFPAQLLVSTEQLNSFAAADSATLGSFFDPLPPVVEISIEWQTLSAQQASELLRYAIGVEAIGVVVCDEDRTVGILSIDTLVKLAPKENARVSKGARSMSDSTVGVRVYVCSRCDRIWSPATGDAIRSAIPSCRSILCSGKMTLMEP